MGEIRTLGLGPGRTLRLITCMLRCPTGHLEALGIERGSARRRRKSLRGPPDPLARRKTVLPLRRGLRKKIQSRVVRTKHKPPNKHEKRKS